MGTRRRKEKERSAKDDLAKCRSRRSQRKEGQMVCVKSPATGAGGGVSLPNAPAGVGETKSK